MKAEITTTTIKVEGNEILSKKENTLYYLIVKTDKGQHIINVGEKTHNAILALEEEKKPNTPNVKPNK